MVYNGFLGFIHAHEERLIAFYMQEMEIFDKQIKEIQADTADCAQQQMQIIMSHDLHPLEHRTHEEYDFYQNRIRKNNDQVEALNSYLHKIIMSKRKLEGRGGEW